MTTATAHGFRVMLATMVLVLLGAAGATQQPAAPVAVRNERPRSGTEVLVLRHQQLRKGAHDDYYRSSLSGVWPWYEKIGTRIVGQWMVVDPAEPAADHAYRLARYASLEHWRATRDPTNARLGGNGGDREKSTQAGRDRGGVQTGSKGAYFLQGANAPTRPLFMPGLDEVYEQESGTATQADPVIAMRSESARVGAEVVELRYHRIAKGRFDELVAHTLDAIWPWEEKLGARPIGQWRVIYPNAPNRTQENAAFDEVVTLTRYASDEHRRAMAADRAVLLGGNGPDWRAWRAALDRQATITLETSTELMRGEMYYSPPVYTPSLGERYRMSK